MIGTIEIIGENFNKKISLLKELANTLPDYKSQSFLKKIDNLETEYNTRTVNILVEYFVFINSSEEKTKYFFKIKGEHLKKYQSIIVKGCFFIRVKQIFTSLCIHIKNKESDDSIDNLLRNFCAIPNNVSKMTSLKMMCEKCNQEMSITTNTSQMFCKKCGMLEKIYGTVFEDNQFYHQEGQRAKHCNYETNKHFKIWVERIQARESKDIPPVVIKKLNKCAENDNIIDRNRISCQLIREYLRDIKETAFNEHVPLIRKLMTGIVPPQLDDIELRKLEIRFDKSISIFEKIKPANKTNCPYHPYFIYKILDIMIQNINRKKQILSCIHLQSRDTLIENDKNWKIICEQIPFFKNKYRPTNRYDNIINY